MIKSNRTVAKSNINTLDLDNRVEIEAQITDARSQALDNEHFKRIETRLSKYASTCPWRTYLFDFLGSMQDKVVLDIACGYSMTPVIFALAGAKKVCAIDVAPKTIATVQQFAEYRGVGSKVDARVGPVEALPFEDETFDIIYGGAAIHHLQLDRAGAELARVLKRGGRGAFQDPLGQNPLLEFVRDYVPYKDRHPVKGTDRPMHLNDVKTFGSYFTTSHYQCFDLLSMAGTALGLKATSPIRQKLHATDMALFNKAPYFQRYARYVVTCVTK
ncbi:MAG: class I SAM-dependent methyltransferase [Chloroflexi bacterium]|nr:class I SAM-dependent methyltransferase [Chloroflexota bacterium]